VFSARTNNNLIMKEYDCGKDENKYAGWNCPLNQLESLVWLCGKNAGVEK